MVYGSSTGMSVAEEQRMLRDRGAHGLAALVLVGIGSFLGVPSCSNTLPKGTTDKVVMSAIQPVISGLANLEGATWKMGLKTSAKFWASYDRDITKGTVPSGQFNPGKISAQIPATKAAALAVAGACDNAMEAFSNLTATTANNAAFFGAVKPLVNELASLESVVHGMDLRCSNPSWRVYSSGIATGTIPAEKIDFNKVIASLPETRASAVALAAACDASAAALANCKSNWEQGSN